MLLKKSFQSKLFYNTFAILFLLLKYKTSAKKLLTALSTIFIVYKLLKRLFQTQYGQNGRKGCAAKHV